MMNPLTSEMWSPYIVGAGIGILSWISFLISDKAIGCSTAFSRTIGMSEVLVRGEKARKKRYYQEFIPKIDWEWMLVLGIIIGAFFSSILSGTFNIETIPNLWERAFGNTLLLRMIAALSGGILIGFGARMAGGCTSGHGISGTLQLAVSSWIALVFFFVGGIITAFIIFEFIGGI